MIRWWMVALAALTVELVAIAALKLSVAAFSLGDPQSDLQNAEDMGRWIGPIGGTFLTFVAALWTARTAGMNRRMHGTFVGIGAALLDVALLMVTRTPFEIIFLLSTLGRVVAGFLGGRAAVVKRR